MSRQGAGRLVMVKVESRSPSSRGEDVLDEDLLKSLGVSKEDIEGANESGEIVDDLPDEGEEEQHTSLKIYEQGFVQAGLMAGGVGLVVLLGGIFLSSSFGVGQGDQAGATQQESAEGRGFTAPSPENKEQELTELRARQALLKQRYDVELSELKRQQQLSAQVNPGENPGGGEDSSGKGESPAPPKVVAPPAEVVVPPPPTPVTPPPDPVQQWQKAQELWRLQQGLGSFGLYQKNGGVLQNHLSSESMGGSPSQQSGDTSSSSTNSNPPSNASDQGTSSSPAKVALANNPADEKLVAEQQAFLAGKVYEPAVPPSPVASARILAGTQVAGRVKSPIIFIEGDESAGNRHFAIELEEPINAGSAVIPSKSLLLGRVETVAPNGVMFLSGSLLILPDGNEFELPSGIVDIRGSGGNPLIASRIAPERMGDFLKAIGSMVVGGSQEAARLFNQPRQQQTIINDRQTVVTSTQPRPNYPAAIVSGAMNAISPRLQQTLQSNPQERGNVQAWSINGGRSVSIFFNRTAILEFS